MVIEHEIRLLRLENGRIPYLEWYEMLSDKRMRVAVETRLARVRNGNFGDHKLVGDGVSELRLDIGPGLRIYYGEYQGKLVILLGGGDKSSQQRDIATAISWWKQWKQWKKK